VMLLVLGCSACVHAQGPQFAKPDPTKIVVGQTTREQVIAIYGEPTQQKSSIITEGAVSNGSQSKTVFDAVSVPGNHALISYLRVESKPPIAGASLLTRSVGFTFWNDRLVDEEFQSSFAEDASVFDETKMSAMRKGQTTRAELISALGEPSGTAIYPVVGVPDYQRLAYQYLRYDLSTRKSSVKRLEILFDRSDRLVDYRFASDVHDLPAAPAPSAPVMMPIIIPHK
jgi:outer membrane protein assembly factor BamE (lipoprotein component of BamABCDE complex)